MLWCEKVKVFDDKTADYYFFRADPFCKDGYTHEMSKELERRGWKIGSLRMVYKDKIPLKEVVKCMIYKRAYKDTYEFVTNSNLYADVPISISQFLNLVEAKAGLISNISKIGDKFPPDITSENLEGILKEEGLITRRGNS